MTINTVESPNWHVDIMVTLMSLDPNLQLAIEAVIGRDRFTRMFQIRTSMDDFDPADYGTGRHAIIVDFGYHGIPDFPFHKLERLKDRKPTIQIIGLIDNDNTELRELMSYQVFDAVLLKHEIGPCPHLVIQACFQTQKVLVTDSVWSSLALSEADYVRIPSVKDWSEQLRAAEPKLSDKQIKIFVLRVFSGLDPIDIVNELSIARNTLKDYNGKLFELLEEDDITRSERTLKLFEFVSGIWWYERFADHI